MRDSATIDDLIIDAASALAEVARWPDSKPSAETAANSIKLLRTALARSPPHCSNAAMLMLAAQLLTEQGATTKGHKRAWSMIADVLP